MGVLRGVVGIYMATDGWDGWEGSSTSCTLLYPSMAGG